MEFAKQAGVKKVLFLSSGFVYGRQPPELENISEDYVGAPAIHVRGNSYAIGKYVAEHLCSVYAAQYNLPVKIARCFSFVGPYLPLDWHFALGNFIQSGLTQKQIVVQGDGSPYRSYLYAADLVIFLLHILQKGDSCVPYNVGSEEAVSVAELARLVASYFNPEPEVKIMQSRSGQLPERYVPSSQRVFEKLGIRPQVSLEQAIEKTIAWHKRYLT